jgi:vitamin B12 transporter
MHFRRFAICFIGFASSPFSVAQDDVVVVTATRVPKRFAELVNDVTVVTRDELDRAGQSSLANVLQAIPGVEVTQNGGFGATAQVFLRGANAGHTLFLVDGMRVGSASTGLTAIEQLPLEQIERIEVLRGPASSLYGSDAIGGVVQIFTRSGRGNPGANAFAGYGTYNTGQLGAGYGYENRGTRFALQAGTISTSGITAVRNPASTSFNPDADGYRNVNVSGQLARSLGGEDEVGLRVFHSEGEKQLDATPRTFDQRLTEDLTAVSAFARNQLARYWRSNLTVGSSLDDLTSFQSPTSMDVFKTHQHQATWQNDFATRLGLVIASLEHLGEHVSGTTPFPVKDRSVDSLFAGYQATLARHQLQASLRRDDNSQFGGYRTWQLGYGFRFTPATRAWANVGTAYKAPTFNQLYFPGFGNPSLRPEQSRGFEIGSQYVAQRLQLGAVYYRSKIDNLIVNAGVPLAPSNIDKADIRGVTLTGKAETRGGAAIAGSLDLQQPEDGTTHKLLPRRARRHASLAASVPAFAGRASAEMIASSERYNDSANAQRMAGYGVLNLAYEQALRRQWKWFARINNATDKRYELVRDFNVPGRTFFFGARYEEKGF